MCGQGVDIPLSHWNHLGGEVEFQPLVQSCVRQVFSKILPSIKKLSSSTTINRQNTLESSLL